jgi:hypothetical protein
MNANPDSTPLEDVRKSGFERVPFSLNPNGIPQHSPGLRGTKLPWVRGLQNNNPNGVATRYARCPKAKPRWGFAFLIRCPRVARSSQPWVLGRNPFGIGIGRLLKSDLRPSKTIPPFYACTPSPRGERGNPIKPSSSPPPSWEEREKTACRKTIARRYNHAG